jgi:hypothetical protein
MDEKQSDQPQDETPEPRRKTHKEFMEELRRDPRFIVHEPRRGEGFIIGGQNPAHPKPGNSIN